MINYWYQGSSILTNRYYPYYSSGVLLYQSLSSAPSCNNRINDWAFTNVLNGSVKTTIDGYKPTEYSIRTQRNSLTDGGNTENLKATILSANSGNISTVINQLQNASPYLSIEVLGLLSSMESPSPFTNTMVRDILFLNPHSSRSTWVQSVLDNRINLLSSGDRAIINSNSSIYTFRDTLESNYSDICEAYDTLLNELLFYHMSDTVYDLDSIRPWLKHPNNINCYYHLAELYFADFDWSNYNQIIDSIPLWFTLTTSQEIYHNTFKDLFEELHVWQQSDTSIYQPDSARLSWLFEFIDEHEDYPEYMNSLMAIYDTSLTFPDVIIPYEDTSSNPFIMIINELNKENKESNLVLYPNPANDELFLKWKSEFNPSIVKIFDINGQIIQEKKWYSNEELRFSVSLIPSGVYYIKIELVNGEHITRKLLIRR